MVRKLCAKCGISIWKGKVRFCSEPRVRELLKDLTTVSGLPFQDTDPIHDGCVRTLVLEREKEIQRGASNDVEMNEQQVEDSYQEDCEGAPIGDELERDFGEEQRMDNESRNLQDEIELVDTQASTQVSSCMSTPSSVKSSQNSSAKSARVSSSKTTRVTIKTSRVSQGLAAKPNQPQPSTGQQENQVLSSAAEQPSKRPRIEDLRRYRNQSVQTDNTLVISSETQISLEGSERSAQEFVETQFSSSTDSQSASHPKRSRYINRVDIGEKQKIMVDIYSVSGANSICCVCRKQKIRKRVPPTARDDMWLSRSIWLPIGTRCCKDHLEGPERHPTLKEQSKTDAAALATQGAWLTRKEIGKLINMITAAARRPHLNMQVAQPCEEDYELLFGLKKEDFEDLLKETEPQLRESIHRSPADALALLLMKMRLGVSQQVLASLFDIPQRKVSRSMWRVVNVLQGFTSKNVGYGSMSREELLAKHDSEYLRKLYQVPRDNLMLFLDATYLYTQKSGDHRMQSGLFNIPKGRHLVKPMMVIAPSGRIVAATGLYFSDYRHNDATMLRHMFEDPHGIASLLKPGDVLIVDRGFRDVVAFLESKGYVVLMPELLKKGQTQFSASEANKSRNVTLSRWRVEALNGRLKGLFKFFDQRISHQYYNKDCNKKLLRLMEVACAIINKYRPPNYVDTPRTQIILEECAKRASLENTLKPEVLPMQKKNKIWNLSNARTYEGFPKMCTEDLERITLGNYQITNAISYVDEHLRSSCDYEIMRHKTRTNLLRVKLRSKYRRSKTHNVYVEHGQSAEEDKILRWYCTCKSGERTMGCCSHVASVIWFLGIRRHELTSPYVPRTFGTGLIEIAKIRMQCDADAGAEDDADTEDGEEANAGVTEEPDVGEAAIEETVGGSEESDVECDDEVENLAEEIESQRMAVDASDDEGVSDEDGSDSEDWSDVEGWGVPLDE